MLSKRKAYFFISEVLIYLSCTRDAPTCWESCGEWNANLCSLVLHVHLGICSNGTRRKDLPCSFCLEEHSLSFSDPLTRFYSQNFIILWHIAYGCVDFLSIMGGIFFTAVSPVLERVSGTKQVLNSERINEWVWSKTVNTEKDTRKISAVDECWAGSETGLWERMIWWPQ